MYYNLRCLIQSILCLGVFLLFIPSSTTAQAIQDDCYSNIFYAVSSLRFHVEELLSKGAVENGSDKDAIGFEKEEAAQLWDRSLSQTIFFRPQLAQARNYYNCALENEDNSLLFTQYCLQSQYLLEEVWNRIKGSTYSREFNFSCLLKKSYPYFENNRLINEQIQQAIQPYLLPYEHPLRSSLDAIFNQFRVLENEESFTRAGFIILFRQPFSQIRVASHPNFPGYLFKVYLDSILDEKEEMPGWMRLMRRCKGAENIRNLIRKRKLKHFCVPDKWLYPIPQEQQGLGRTPQPVILIVTDMGLVSKANTKVAWRHHITREHLDELYCIFSHGYSSTALVKNIPYTKIGMFACIDTEWPKRKLDYKKVRKFLSREMRVYWDTLVKTGGNPKNR